MVMSTWDRLTETTFYFGVVFESMLPLSEPTNSPPLSTSGSLSLDSSSVTSQFAKYIIFLHGLDGVRVDTQI